MRSAPRIKHKTAPVKIVFAVGLFNLHRCIGRQIRLAKLFKENVKDTCQVWPGIELDVIGASGKKGHLILISNPEDVELFSQKMNELLND